MKIIGGLLLLSCASFAADVPSGWKIVKDRKETCQMAVPADWKVAELGGKPMGSATAPDRKADATVHGQRPGVSWDQNKSMVQQMLKPVKMIEDSGSRLWYTREAMNGRRSEGTNWYVAVPGKDNICSAQVSFQDAAFEANAKKIAMSIGPVK